MKSMQRQISKVAHVLIHVQKCIHASHHCGLNDILLAFHSTSDFAVHPIWGECSVNYAMPQCIYTLKCLLLRLKVVNITCKFIWYTDENCDKIREKWLLHI